MWSLRVKQPDWAAYGVRSFVDQPCRVGDASGGGIYKKKKIDLAEFGQHRSVRLV